MSEEKLERALEVAIDAAREAGMELLKYFGKIEPESKSESGNEATDIVTKLDTQTEALLAKRLSAFDGSIGFRGEEFGVKVKSDTTWLVDPIDGTSHFVRGIPFCTTMIALVEDGEVVLAVINDFVRNETYWAIKGKGAFRNGDRIHVSSRSLSQAMVSFETKFKNPENVQALLKLDEISGGIVHTINCGFEFTMIASGKLDGRVTKDPYGYDWDYAPGTLLVKEAGGVVVNHGSDSYDYTNHDFIAANPIIVDELTKLGFPG